ncbi:golvesin C-terminal-like domain-containing protein [Streptomyces sp. BR1]|uniref:golvesin C-terminal-like domain-containing protein n=1 Tax=Streptomyces sp. BR1 TaxID=1592323 RepID=UPI00402B2BC1
MATATVVVMSLMQGGQAWAGQPAREAASASAPLDVSGGNGAGQPQPPRQEDSPRVLSPNSVLPKTWKTSTDRAVTVAGDGSGLHVLAADSNQAYQWRTVATLAEPGFGTDLWIGNACVTGSGKRAVVVYAPRAFTNKPELMERGGFAAVVDLAEGKVTKLADTVSLAYFNPGCGTGETAVLTQLGGDKDARTRLLTVDATTGSITHQQTENVQVTSAVPVGDRVVGAAAGRLVSFERNKRATELATTAGPAFQLRADGEGGVSFLDRTGSTARARRTADGRTTTFAQGPIGALGLQAGTSGRVFLTGTPASTTTLPTPVRQLKVAADATVSSTGALAVDQAVSKSLRSHVSNPLAATAWNAAAPLQITTEVPSTGKKISFTAGQDSSRPKGAGKSASPALTGSRAPEAKGTTGAPAPAAAGDPSSTVDTDRTCSMPRNDPSQQAYQPTPNQVEWAADMAIRGNLTSAYVRQGGWRSAAGLGTVDPQGMFPLPALAGTNGGRIPAQVLLGVLAQESNLWQAEGGALPGQTSSTLASTNGFYGHPSSPATPQDHWQIDWDHTDCGYGIGQQTDGMKIGEPNELPAGQQKAIALDYTSNIAAAAQTLAKKWNELHTVNPQPNAIKLNTDDPVAPENWFAALWNYNSGMNPYVPADPTAPWGLGYLNNPSNPLYPPDRHAFLDHNSYADAAHPQQWSYAEKVLGWGAWPIDTGRSYADTGEANKGNTAGYSPAWWSSDGNRSTVKPGLDTFCKPTENACDPANPPRCEIDHMGPDCDPPHWYHVPQTSWKVNCPSSCGHEYLTYKTLKTELGNGNNGAGSMCNNTRPASGMLVVDDVPTGVPTFTDGCSKSNWTNEGTFSFSPFQADTKNHYEAKGDLHQIGGGFGDHFWYAHTRNTSTGIDLMKVTGNWTLNRTLDNQWARVFVHVPDTGAQTQQAHYQISGLTSGGTRDRYLNQHPKANTWVELGAYQFNGSPQVSLSNETDDGTADDDIAWDAVAFQPLGQKPRNMVAVLGDSYSSGEGAGSYSPESDTSHDDPTWNACRRSANSWALKSALPDKPGSTIGERISSSDGSIDLQNASCSGALTWNVRGKYTDASGNDIDTWPLSWNDRSKYLQGDGQFHEAAQLKSGVLSSDTTLVALTIGGNDAGFPNVVRMCATTGCPSESDVQHDIDGTIPKIQKVLEEIHGKAGNAKIILMGYPQLFDESAVACVSGVGGAGMARLNAMARYMASQQGQLVASLQAKSLPVTYESPDDDFAYKRACDNPEGINKVVTAPHGDGDFRCTIGGTWCVSRESYHPNSVGTTAYAQAFTRAITKL